MRPPARRAPVDVGRDLVARHAKGGEHRFQRDARLDRRAGAVPAQVEIHLAAGEPVRDLVREVHGEGRLADPAHPLDRRDRRGRVGVG